MPSSLLFPPSRDSQDLKTLSSNVRACLVTFWKVKQLGTHAPLTHAGTGWAVRRHRRLLSLGSRQSLLPSSAELVLKCPLPSSYKHNLF